jgi:hypothetical protein
MLSRIEPIFGCVPGEFHSAARMDESVYTIPAAE